MKFTITKLTRALGLLGLGVMAMLPGKSGAQICSAANSWGCGHNLAGNITDIRISNSAGTLASYTGLGCSATTTSNVLVNAGSPITLTAGENITFDITGNTDIYGYSWSTRVGIWLDVDRNNSFSAAECLANPQSGIWSSVGTTPVRGTIKMPCWSSTGLSTLRFRGSSSVYTPPSTSQGCGTVNTYGNIIDVSVDLKVGTPPVANFIVPTGPNYENTVVKFNATSPNTFYTYTWTFGGPNVTPVQATGTVGRAVWSPPSPPTNYDVKLLVDYCGVRDSISKTVRIVRPVNAPVADFIAKANQVEIFFNAEMLDLSSNGAFKWSWEATSPTGNVYTSTQQNPVFMLDELGKWDFCLESENNVGKSNKLCKSQYVECTPPSEYFMGPTKEGNNQKGILYDNGGRTAPYGANRRPSIDYFKILPCGAKEIRLRFNTLRLADANDILRIYDADQAIAGREVTGPSGITGANQGTWRNRTVRCTSGAVYITFETNASGQDSGFAITWDSDLAPPVKPEADFTTPYNPAAIATNVVFTNTSRNVQGSPSWEWWDDDGNFGTGKDFTATYFSDGGKNVCLAASTCNGRDTFCTVVDIVTPTQPGMLDFTASDVRPPVGTVVELKATTDYANRFLWNIFPTTYTIISGTLSSQNLQVRFNTGGCYTFTLEGWNSAESTPGSTEKKVIKNKYVCVLDYCIPLTDLISSDIGINEVTLKKGTSTLLSKQTTSGVVPYSDYTSTDVATLTFGASYDLSVARLTNSNTVNYKAWVDWNIDGDFTDAGEEVMSSGTITGLTASGTVTVPVKSASFEGKTRLRVAASYGNFSNTPCGVNIVGEYEDYGLILANDNAPPVITLVGADTLYVERTSSAGACWAEAASTTYKAEDPTEGDVTSKVVLTSDLDCTIPGIYSIDFNVVDASGNAAPTKRRTIFVVLDKTPPVLTLNGSSVVTIEQCGTFTDPGAVATDIVDGNLSTAIVTTGSVNSSVVGDYTLTYTVKDAQGNTSSATRTVRVRDTKKPGIYTVGVRIANNTTVKLQINSTFVDNIYAEDECNGPIDITKTPGFNGPVNTAVRATYPVSYFATDPNGNKADEDGFVINYQVDDYIAPVISLNTEDVILHDVNNPYTSRNVTVNDNYYPLNKVSVVKSGSVDPYTLGTYTETYTATDESGNTATKVRTVIVVDRVAPEILAPAMNACVGQPFWAMSGLVLRDNYYSPATLSPLVQVLNHNVNIWEAGVYYINYVLADPSGNNAAMVTRPVFVNYPPNCQNTFLSTSSLSLSEAVNVFPNPTTGKVKVSYALVNNEVVNVVVTDVTGRTVATLNNLKGGLGFTEIDLGKFGSGVYNITLTNNGQTTTKKVMVQN